MIRNGSKRTIFVSGGLKALTNPIFFTTILQEKKVKIQFQLYLRVSFYFSPYTFNCLVLVYIVLVLNKWHYVLVLNHRHETSRFNSEYMFKRTVTSFAPLQQIKIDIHDEMVYQFVYKCDLNHRYQICLNEESRRFL